MSGFCMNTGSRRFRRFRRFRSIAVISVGLLLAVAIHVDVVGATKLVMPANEVFEIHLDGRVVGWARSRFSQARTAYTFREESEMAIIQMGQPQRLKTSTEVETDLRVWPKRFRFESTGSGQTMSVTGRIGERDIMMNISLNGEEFTKVIKSKGQAGAGFSDILLAPILVPRLQKMGLGKTRLLKTTMFEPQVFSLVPITVNVKRERDEPSPEEETFKVWTRYLGQELTSWVTHSGRTARARMQLGKVVLELQPFEPSLLASLPEITSPGMDIVAATAVSVDGAIQNPKKAKRLKLQVDGLSKAAASGGLRLENHRQERSGDHLVLSADRLPKKAPALTALRKPEFAEYLASDESVNSTHPEIDKAAREIVGTEKNSLRAAQKLSDWVYKNIRKESVAAMPDAVSVWRQRRGDCNEHTTLFAALARAIGIPTKIHVGLVYSPSPQGGAGYFLYHAWPSVYVGEWVSIDPTWGEFPASVTHISLQEGGISEQIKVANAVGHLSVKVLEVR